MKYPTQEQWNWFLSGFGAGYMMALLMLIAGAWLG